MSRSALLVRRTLPCVASLLAATSLSAQSALTADAARQDYDVLVRALAEAHGGFARFAPRATVVQRLASYRARIAGPIDRRAFTRLVAEAVATLRDGHLRLEYDSATTSQLAAARVLPLRVVLEGDRVVVQSNDTPTDTLITPGMQLRRINGRDATDVVRALLPVVSGDGFIETGKRSRIARALPQLYWLYIAPDSVFTLEAQTPAGVRVTATLLGIVERDRRTFVNPVSARATNTLAQLDGPPGLVALSFPDSTPDNTVARLRIRAFDGATWVAQLDTAFATIRARNAKAVILDLRGNGGGVDEYGANLVGRFLTQPFRYFDYIRLASIAPSFATWKPSTFEQMKNGTTAFNGEFRVLPSLHTGVAMQQPAAQPFTGKLIVLIDGASFSTTADVSAQLRSHRRATFLGEETGGGYAGNTSALNAQITLPTSGLRLKIQMYDYWNAVTPVPGGRGTMPDEAVRMTMADVLRGVDPILDRARALARQP